MSKTWRDGDLELPWYVGEGELEIETALHRLGIEAVHQHRIKGTHYIADFFLPYHRRTILEVDGPTHQDARAAERDAKRDVRCRASDTA